MNIRTTAINPFQDQKAGTSGLRKPVSIFQQEHYSESFIQSIFNVLGVADKSVVIGGDGRFYNDEVIQKIIAMAAAQKAKQIFIGEKGLLSTPAASHAIRHYQADYGIILSASHNSGGPEGDFGIKVNLKAGQPAPETVTNAIFKESQQLASYQSIELEKQNINKIKSYRIQETQINIISTTDDYIALMRNLFDFSKIKAYLVHHPIAFDAMHAVTGPYAYALFHEALGLDEKYLLNTTPQEDFAGGHPDPQPSYCQDLYNFIKNNPEIVMGAASDGDGDRNLISGRKYFINPCDSLAIIAEQHSLIPCLRNLKGVARTLPTTRAIDMVCAEKGMDCYETPTGWKFFANLIDSDRIQLCGEESFGTGSNHIREKDGLWAILCWLNILAETNKAPDEIVAEFWLRYGRVYFNRYDFTELDDKKADEMFHQFEPILQKEIGKKIADLTITSAGQFHYTDPTNKETAYNQGVQICFGRQAKITCRLSGTGTRGATLRIYCEYWQQPGELAPALVGTTATLLGLAQGMMDLHGYCGRTQPDNIV